MIRFASGKKYGPKFAAPFLVIWRAFLPSASATNSSSAIGRIWLSATSSWYAAISASVLGRDARQVTRNGAANFGPYFFPDAKRIIYASNSADPGGRNFDLWMIKDDGTGAERVTFNDTFDGFPMFSPDGKSLVFASNRNAAVKGETNLFMADWVE